MATRRSQSVPRWQGRCLPEWGPHAPVQAQGSGVSLTLPLALSVGSWVGPSAPREASTQDWNTGSTRVARSYLGTSWLWLPCLLLPHPQASDHSFPGSLGISDKFRAHHKIPRFNKISLIKDPCKSERWANLSLPVLLEHLKPIKFKWLEFGKTWTVIAKLLGFILKSVFT